MLSFEVVVESERQTIEVGGEEPYCIVLFLVDSQVAMDWDLLLVHLAPILPFDLY